MNKFYLVLICMITLNIAMSQADSEKIIGSWKSQENKIEDTLTCIYSFYRDSCFQKVCSEMKNDNLWSCSLGIYELKKNRKRLELTTYLTWEKLSGGSLFLPFNIVNIHKVKGFTESNMRLSYLPQKNIIRRSKKYISGGILKQYNLLSTKYRGAFRTKTASRINPNTSATRNMLNKMGTKLPKKWRD